MEKLESLVVPICLYMLWIGTSMNKDDRHYLTCQDDNCERAACTARREYEEKILSLELRNEALQRWCDEYKKRIDAYSRLER
jgi:hypothetical protein